MVQVDEHRLAKLLRKEWKLNHLENGGVDNWCGYEDSLYPDNGATWEDIENLFDEDIIKKFLS